MTFAAPDLALVRHLADRTLAYPYKVWGYGESIGLEALLAAAEATGEARYFEFVNRLLEDWCAARPQIEYTDHVAPGTVLLAVYRQTASAPLLDQARRLAAFFAGLPRGAAGAALHRPDHPQFNQYVYVDCLYTDAPFLCSLAQVTGDASYYRLAVDLLLGHLRLLQDERTGLFYHLYDCGQDRANGAFWGRGNGWAILALIKTLQLLPPDVPERAALHGRLLKQATTLAELQDASGHWHTVLDQPNTYLETSLAAFFGAAFTQAVRLGLLPESYLPPARAAWAALAGRIDEAGNVMGVSPATPPGDAAHYDRVPAGGLWPWGQGPALLAALGQHHFQAVT